jgi:hypothetical protein
MQKILELVIIGIIIPLVGEATFDLLKGKFGQLEMRSKIALLAFGTVTAVFLVILEEEFAGSKFRNVNPNPFLY